MSTVLDLLANQLDDSTLSQLSRQLGADTNQTEQAVNAALPMLLAALSRNAATPEGAQSLTRALARDHDGSILNHLVGALGNRALSADGQKILGHVLGGRQRNVMSGVSRVSGLDENRTGQLLALLAPLVMGALGQVQQQRHLDANGVANLLSQDRAESESQLGGLARLLDLDGDGNPTDDMMMLGTNLLGSFFRRR